MLLVGHTKFTPDIGFGLIKQKYKKTNVERLMVNNSAALNETKFVETQDGQTLVPRRCQTSSSTINELGLCGINTYLIIMT